MEKTTEKPSHYRHLEKMDVADIVKAMNQEDQGVSLAVQQALPAITALAKQVWQKMEKGGRLFYLGSGTSGRLGILDASECPPTFGVDHGLVIGLIAGGDTAIRKAQEKAEDDMQQGFKDLQEYEVSDKDVVVGLSASGTTPYVLGALKTCKEHGITTGAITCNKQSAIGLMAHFPVEVVVGPEFVTGSTRLKSGTAQKMVLNMLTTSVMIKLGRVKDNRMVDMHLSNDKLVERGAKMLVELYGWPLEEAKNKLLAAGSVRQVINQMEKQA